MALSSVGASATGVVMVDIRAMCPAVVIVRILPRGPGRGGITRATIAIAWAIVIGVGALGLLDNGVFDDINEGLGIYSAASKSLGVNSDSLGGNSCLVL